jgi:hypothetical protein
MGMVPGPARGWNENRSSTGGLGGFSACHRRRVATAREAVQNVADLQEIHRADIGTHQDLLLRLRRIGGRHEGQDLRALPSVDAALAAEPSRVIRTERDFTVIALCRRIVCFKDILPGAELPYALNALSDFFKPRRLRTKRLMN